MKHRLDYRSITFKTWLYFILFTTFLMIILWFLQVLFLNNFYEVMKRRTDRCCREKHQKSLQSQRQRTISRQYRRNLRYTMISIFTLPRSTEVRCISNHPAIIPVPGITPIRSQRSMKSCWNAQEDSVSFTIDGTDDSKKILAYGNVLIAKNKTPLIVYTFSPLWPVSSIDHRS